MTTPVTEKLTGTQQRLLDALADGQWHTQPELLLAITGRRFASPSLVPTHVLRLRARLGDGHRIDSSPAGYRLVENEGTGQ